MPSMGEDTFDGKLAAKITELEEDGQDLAASRPATPESRTATPNVPEKPGKQLSQEAQHPNPPPLSLCRCKHHWLHKKIKKLNEKLEIADHTMKESTKGLPSVRWEREKDICKNRAVGEWCLRYPGRYYKRTNP